MASLRNGRIRGIHSGDSSSEVDTNEDITGVTCISVRSTRTSLLIYPKLQLMEIEFLWL